MRDFRIFVPRDCLASESKANNDYALKQMERFLKADIRTGARIPLADLMGKSKRRRRCLPVSDRSRTFTR